MEHCFFHSLLTIISVMKNWRTFRATCASPNNGYFVSKGTAGLVNWNTDLLEPYLPLLKLWTVTFEALQNNKNRKGLEEHLLKLGQERHILSQGMLNISYP